MRTCLVFVGLLLAVIAVSFKLLVLDRILPDKIAASPNAGLADEDLAKTEFDFIVVGSGSSGAAVAYRLANANNKAFKVLLLEAGSHDADLNVKMPPAFPKVLLIICYVCWRWRDRTLCVWNTCFLLLVLW